MGELLLVVQAKTQARAHPTAAARPLVGGGLTDGFDRQAEHSGFGMESRNSCVPQVDHGTHPGHRHAGLGHIGREHDAATGSGSKHFGLVFDRKPAVQRENFPTVRQTVPLQVTPHV